jgi:subtilisin family serine protease
MSQSVLDNHMRPSTIFRFFPMLCLLTLFLTLGSSGAWAANSRYIVLFREGTPLSMQESIVALSGSTTMQRLPLVDAITIELPLGNSTPFPALSLQKSALDFLLNHLEIEAVEFDAPIAVQSETTPSGSTQGGPIAPTNSPPQSAGGYTWNLQQIDLDIVERNADGRQVGIAVIDTGIDPFHPRLSGVVVGGYNARVGENPNDYMDHHGHGTHVAGIIAAAVGLPYTPQVMRGIAPQASLYAVRVLDDTGGGYISDLVHGLSWVAQHPTIHVVNMSVGFYKGSRALKRAVKLLYKAGVVLVASAGNCDVVAASSEGGESEGGESEGGESTTSTTVQGCQGAKPMYPAAYRETIAVGATDVDRNIAYYSITGSYIDVVAPGGSHRTRQVLSTTTTIPSSAGVSGAAASEGGESEGGESEGGESATSMNAGLYGWASGTSQAAPHVTGIVALMRSVNPLLTPAHVLQILQETTLPLNAPRKAQGAGLVNAPRAVERAKLWR